MTTLEPMPAVGFHQGGNDQTEGNHHQIISQECDKGRFGFDSGENAGEGQYQIPDQESQRAHIRKRVVDTADLPAQEHIDQQTPQQHTHHGTVIGPVGDDGIRIHRFLQPGGTGGFTQHEAGIGGSLQGSVSGSEISTAGGAELRIVIILAVTIWTDH